MKYFLFLSCVLLTLLSYAQEKNRNNTWLIGSTGTPIRLRFSNPYDLNIVDNQLVSTPYPVFSFGGSCVSDTNGNLLFGCNGFINYNNEGFGINGFDIVNNPLGNKLYNYYGGDGFWNQMSIILPKKNNSYYVFTTGMSDWAFDDWKVLGTNFRFDVLSYHIVDMDANEGKGKVVEKNKILMQDARLSHNRMSAVRHANGRDWWLVKPHQNDQTFYFFLVKPDTIEGPFIRHSNFSMDSVLLEAGIHGIQGQSTFSPDGQWYAMTEPGYKGAFVYKVDRCDGLLKDYYFFKQPFIDTTLFDYSVGVCFSSDCKLLYLTTGANIYQFKISDTSLNTAIHISGPDTVLQFFPEYNLTYLGPNDKIYVGNWHGTQNGMSYIDKPNERGLACNYKPKGLRQPYTNLKVPPNLPFYGLGALKGSPCDTIKPPYISVAEIKIYPNPASDKMTLEFPQGIQNAEVTISNMLGQRVYTYTFTEILNNKIELSVRHLARALYSIKIVTDGEQFVSKFVRE